MNETTGTFRAGSVVLDEPVNWPDGVRVSVQPIQPAEPPLGMSEEQQSDNPQKIAEWLARFDVLEPLEWTPEEEAGLAAFRAEVKRVTLDAVRRRMESVE